MSNFEDAFARVYPEVAAKGFSVREDFSIFDGTGEDVVYDKSTVDAAVAEIEAELAATEYQRQRAPEYPSMAAFADAMYWNSTGDSTKLDEYYAACAAVKAKYPKPEAD